MTQDELAMVLYGALDRQDLLFSTHADLSYVQVEGRVDLLKVADDVLQAVAKADAARRKA